MEILKKDNIVTSIKQDSVHPVNPPQFPLTEGNVCSIVHTCKIGTGSSIGVGNINIIITPETFVKIQLSLIHMLKQGNEEKNISEINQITIH